MKYVRNINLKKSRRELEALLGILKLRKGYEHGLQRVIEKVKKTPLQKTVLRKLYSITHFPSTSTRSDLSLLLGIPQRSIQVWFQNTRQADKRNPEDLQKIIDHEPDDIPVDVLLNIVISSKY